MNRIQQDQPKLKLIVAYDCGEELKTISENPKPEIIECTMQAINWKKFHVVQLKDQEGNALHISGSLKDGKLGSGHVTELNHRVKMKSPKSVEEMTRILVDFLENENY